MRFLLIFLCSGLAFSYVQAEPAGDLSTFLHGGASKTWVQEAVTVELGEGSDCLTGHELTFVQDGTMTEKVCGDGRLVSIERSYTITTDELDTFVTFEGQSYRLSGRRFEQELLLFEEAILRIEDAKDVPTENRILQRLAE